MDFKLNELQQDIRDIAREYAQKCVLPRVDEIEKAVKYIEGELPQSEFDIIWEEYDGLELTATEFDAYQITARAYDINGKEILV